MSDYPVLKIRLENEDDPPASRYVRVSLDGQDISGWLRHLEIAPIDTENKAITATMTLIVRPDIEIPVESIRLLLERIPEYLKGN